MSAALTQPKKLEHGTPELTESAEMGVPEKLEARPVIELTKATKTERGSTSDTGMTLLMRSACDGLAGTVQALLDRGDDVNTKRSDGLNALAMAAFFGHSQVVWLLLENGADLAATGRSDMQPEMWADARGFVDIGDILREARATKQAEESNPCIAVIDERARFPRPAENEKPQPTGVADPAECSVIDEATDSETTLVRPTPAAEGSPERETESPADIFPSDKPEHAPEPVVKQPLRAFRTLPEIRDPPPLMVPEFRPGSAFVARVTSSRKNLVALILAVWLFSGGIAYFLIPQIRKSLAHGQTEAGTKTTNLPKEPSNPVAGSGANLSGTVEPSTAVTAESTTPAASKDIEQTTSDTPADTKSVESTSRFESAEVSEKSSAGIATARGSESRAHTWSGNRVPEAFENKREFSVATSMSRFVAPARKQRAFSRALKFKQQTMAEELPKPAPLSVEVSRGRSVLSAPARSANEVMGSQPPPLSIISDKPKSKVIQWP